MNNQFGYRTIILKPAKQRSLLNFHPWVFSGAIQTNVKDFIEGEIVEVFDSSNQYLATGHFHHGSIMIRILTFNRELIDESFWKREIVSAFELRKSLPQFKNDTNCYRLVHGEGDGLTGLVIDIYNTTAVIQSHSTGMMNELNDISAALQSIVELNLKTIYVKKTDSGSSKAEKIKENMFLLGNDKDGVVHENGIKFYIDWEEGQKTGFFLDQRDNRKLLGTYAAGKKVLNTFCYSGGFSMYALKAGAAHVDSVDASKKAIEWTDKNFELNFAGNTNHTSHCSDVFDFLKSNGSEYDVIILDPPAFAKHLSAVDKAVIGYRNLNYDAIKRIKPGGIIFTFSCSQAIDKQLFRKTVFTAAVKANRKVRILHQLSQGTDHPINLYHPESEYLKGLVLQVL